MSQTPGNFPFPEVWDESSSSGSNSLSETESTKSNQPDIVLPSSGSSNPPVNRDDASSHSSISSLSRSLLLQPPGTVRSSGPNELAKVFAMLNDDSSDETSSSDYRSVTSQQSRIVRDDSPITGTRLSTDGRAAHPYGPAATTQENEAPRPPHVQEASTDGLAPPLAISDENQYDDSSSPSGNMAHESHQPSSVPAHPSGPDVVAQLLARLGDPVSDDPTSSDENESMSPDESDYSPPYSTPALPKFRQDRLWTPPEEDDRPSEPRKVSAPRDAILEAYNMIAVIQIGLEKKEKGKEQSPWKRVGSALEVLSGSMKQSNFATLPAFTRSFQLLLVVIEHDLIPLAKDKKYVRSLSKPEAKAIYPFLNTWSTLKSEPPILDTAGLAFLTAYPRAPLARIARCALGTSPKTLDMSDLGLTVDDLRGRVNLAMCLSLFNIETESVSEIDLRYNRLTSIPKSFGRSFTSVKELHISKNPIDSLPVALLKIPRFTMPDNLAKYFKLIMKRFPIPQRPPTVPRSLVGLCALVILRHQDSDTLDILTVDWLQQSVLDRFGLCELCDGLASLWYQSTVTWKETKIDFSGMLCQRCLAVAQRIKFIPLDSRNWR